MKEIKQLTSQRDGLKNTINVLTATVASKDETNTDLQAKLDEKVDEVDKLQEKLKTQEWSFVKIF